MKLCFNNQGVNQRSGNLGRLLGNVYRNILDLQVG